MGCTALLKKASLVGAFFVFGGWVFPALALCPPPDGASSALVQQVIDGDTLRLADGRRVRLIGINAPELGHRGRPAEPLAEAARERLQQLVKGNADRVTLLPGSQVRDRYGRTLAHAYDARGRNWEAQLLAEGLGYLVAVAPNVSLVDCQLQAEHEARSDGRGLWRRPAWKSPEQLRGGGFALVRAAVRRVERNRGGLWIELDGPLVLHVEPRLLGQFDLAALQRLPGRRIEARGWVVDRARRGGTASGRVRWMLPLTHPVMLEVLP